MICRNLATAASRSASAAARISASAVGSSAVEASLQRVGYAIAGAVGRIVQYLWGKFTLIKWHHGIRSDPEEFAERRRQRFAALLILPGAKPLSQSYHRPPSRITTPVARRAPLSKVRQRFASLGLILPLDNVAMAWNTARM
jgi:hypothetical protein